MDTERAKNMSKLQERTLFILKPECFEDDIIPEVLRDIINLFQGELELKKVQLFNGCEDKWFQHYAEHSEKNFFDDLIKRMTRGPVIIGVISGKFCVEILRNKVGVTDPIKADEFTLRHKYGKSVQMNVVHASDSLKSAEREIKIWFGDR